MKKYVAMMRKKHTAALAFIFFMLAAEGAFALSYDFIRISNNGTESILGQLGLEATDNGNGAIFTFTNDVGIDSSIKSIHFDLGDTGLFTDISIFQDSGDGVTFSEDERKPKNLPEGNTIGFSTDYSAGADGKAANGVDAADEWISFLALYGSGETFDSLLTAEGFRVGLHAISIGGPDGFSDSYVTGGLTPPDVSTVPLPAAAWLFGTALLGFFVASKKRRAIH